MIFKKLSKRQREHILPFTISFTLPWLTVLNTLEVQGEISATTLVIRWLMGSSYLLLIWYLNAFLLNRKKRFSDWLKVIAGNLVVIAIFLLPTAISPDLIPDYAPRENILAVVIRLMIAPLIFIAIQASIKAIRENAQLKTENFALQTENYRAQLDQLKKQVNPHFLFNSLSTLQTMIRTTHQQSEEFVIKLSEVYRQFLQTRETNLVSLKEELEFLESFVFLLKTRHGAALQVEIQSLPKAMGLQLPTFSLQLLVENCTKHNVVSESRPLKIEIFQNDPNHITVVNNLQPKKNVQSHGVGLENLRQRYALLDVEEGIEVFRDEDTYSVTLKLI